MKKLTIYLVFISVYFTILTGCDTHDNASEMASSSFITKLGNDTLAVEVFSITENTATAKVLLRSPRTMIREYSMSMDENGMMQSLDATYLDPQTDSVTRTDRYFWEGDSLRFEINQGERSRSGAAAPPREVLPFIDMVHWPFDLMLTRAYQNEGISQQPLISGSRVFDFEIHKIDDDSMTVKHPTRGTMGTYVNEKGEMTFLEASQTTRALTVTRTDQVDFDALASRFLARDKEGRNFGALSGRGAFDETILGAHIKIDYGTPSKRGRDIWGGLIKYGVRWRTGANRATHFSTDKDLIFGDLAVPAGEYTLFTIPEENGGILIINKQTGQNGQTYDEALDLGRLPLTFRNLDQVVEIFTITVSEEEGKGMIRLQWDDKELVASFEVK